VATSALADRLRAHLGRARLVPEPGGALLAVSGGADSLALLDLMAQLAAEFDLDLAVAHVDHGIHPRSGEVAETVRSLAADRYGLPAVVGALALGREASETRARQARYRFLRRVQAERSARYLVTAHHGDDQVETVLLRLLRGSAPAGLAGIAPTGPRGLVRPLLPFRRVELAAHVAALGLPVFDDPANRDERHTRAWVRHQVLPLLDARGGGAAREALLAVAEHAARDVRAWDAVLGVLPGLDVVARSGRVEVARAVLSGYDNALAGRILRAAARQAELVIGPAAAARAARLAAAAPSGRRLMLGGSVVAEAAFDRLVLERAGPPPSGSRLAGASGQAGFGSFQVRWTTEPAPRRLTRAGWVSWFLPGALAVRPPARGDRLVPLGGTGHRTVARLLMEADVGRGDRARWPVVISGEQAAWIPGVCRGSLAVPEPGAPAVRVEVGNG
jgi:tRNA(Ile)-lysidine synthase